MADSFRIIAVIGPTASGKSAAALTLAERIGAEILCVDSMTIYRGMDAGTAKPTAAEQARVRHHLLDIVEPTGKFAVAKFVELADEVIVGARRRKVPLIAVGGTPMYFKALFEGLFEGPGADEDIRSNLRRESNESLHARLSEVDPVSAGRIHVNDQKRMIRALEIYELTGQPISSLQTHWSESGQRRHEATWIGLLWDRETLSRRINARVKQMIEAGWLDEVRGLLGRYGDLGATAAEAAGYSELTAHLRGQISLADAIEQIKISTRQLSRRQIKWFRRFPNVMWVDGAKATELVVP